MRKDSLKIKNAAIFIEGYEWGPGVPLVIFELSGEAKRPVKTGSCVSTDGKERKILRLYLSDAQGNPVTDAKQSSRYVAAELKVTAAVSGNPFTYDHAVTHMNQWTKQYALKALLRVDGQELSFETAHVKQRICPETDVFADRSIYAGSYRNPMTGKKERVRLNLAAYEPEALLKDKKKNPLVIWLHGMGEGGDDPDIVLLGNEVVALAQGEIQNQFTTEGGADGAYVLILQAPTYWMDGGDAGIFAGDKESRYTEILMDAICDYLEKHPDVDRTRIYIGGCSNGGFMTIHMLLRAPGFFAAAYPICEAYAYHRYARKKDGSYKVRNRKNGFGLTQTQELWVTPEKIALLKNEAIWFVQSADDHTVEPAQYAMPTYRELLRAGAKKALFSMFRTVKGTDDPRAKYPGHFSWVYVFKNQVTRVQDREKIKGAEGKDFGFVPTNDGGGSEIVQEGGVSYETIFAWMNAQRAPKGGKL